MTFRLPYPMPFYTRGVDGRIDPCQGRLEGPRPLGYLQLILAEVYRNQAKLGGKHSPSVRPIR